MLLMCHPNNEKRLLKALNKEIDATSPHVHLIQEIQISTDGYLQETRQTDKLIIKEKYKHRFIEYEESDLSTWCLALDMSEYEEAYVFYRINGNMLWQGALALFLITPRVKAAM